MNNKFFLIIVCSVVCINRSFSMEIQEPQAQDVLYKTLKEEIAQTVKQEVTLQIKKNDPWLPGFISYFLPSFKTILVSCAVGGLIIKYRFWASGADIQRANQDAEKEIYNAYSEVNEYEKKNVEEINKKIDQTALNVHDQVLSLATIIQMHDSKSGEVSGGLKSATDSLSQAKNETVELIKKFNTSFSDKSATHKTKLEAVMGASKKRMNDIESKMNAIAEFTDTILKGHYEINQKFEEISNVLRSNVNENKEGTLELVRDIQLTEQQFNKLNETVNLLESKLDDGIISSIETLQLLDSALNKNKQTPLQESKIEELQSLVGLMIDEQSGFEKEKKKILSFAKKQPKTNTVLQTTPEIPQVHFDDKKKASDGQLLIKER